MILESVLIVGFAILIDLKFGDPKNRYHPTAWMGSLIAKLAPLARSQSPVSERLGGVALIMLASAIVLTPIILLAFGLSLISEHIAAIASVIAGAVLLKTTFAIRGMERHAKSVLDAIDADDLDSARNSLSMIVKRDTGKLDRQHVISGVLESVSENTVDGITGPLFYYALFGLPGAFLYRLINTADSMIGYKSDIFKNIGWFAASFDTVLNYIPSRLTGCIMVVASAILNNNWRESYRVMVRDGKKTASQNAGYPMGALAGALEAKFEKIGHYELGNSGTILTRQHIHSALSLMKLTSVLFFGIVTVPIILILSVLGWWAHA